MALTPIRPQDSWTSSVSFYMNLAMDWGSQVLWILQPGQSHFELDDVFSRNLEDHSTGKLYPEMTDAERVSASQNTGNLHWVGANVVAASGRLTGGVDPPGHVRMYAPNPQQPGSSVSHFDTALMPNELMEPFYIGPNHDVGLTSELFRDLGWEIMPPAIVAAVLPGSRSVQLGFSATAFATIINLGPGTAIDCGIAAITNLPAAFQLPDHQSCHQRCHRQSEHTCKYCRRSGAEFCFCLNTHCPDCIHRCAV